MHFCQEEFRDLDNYEEILSRLKLILNARSDADVARGLGISTAALSSFKKQGKFPYERLARFCLGKGFSFDWLLTGLGNKELQNETRRPEATDTRIEGLIDKLRIIYKLGNLKERAEVTGIIEEVFYQVQKEQAEEQIKPAV